MMDLAQEMQLIRSGQKSQFAQPILIKAAQLVQGVEVRIPLGQLCSTLWLPPTVVTPVGGVPTVVANPLTVVMGIRINSPGAPMLPWGLQGNNISTFTGAVEEIYVTLLAGVASDFILLGARGVGVGYSGGLTAAGTVSASPSFGTSSSPAS